jgi:hypothetical protein
MYGKDFSTIAEVIGTKTAKHVRDFFVTYQRRFNLDDILDEFYKEQHVTTVREDSQVTKSMMSFSTCTGGITYRLPYYMLVYSIA